MKIKWRYFNIAAWVTIIMAYILPYRITETYTKFGYPITFLQLHNKTSLADGVGSLLSSLALDPLILLIDILIVYAVILGLKYLKDKYGTFKRVYKIIIASVVAIVVLFILMLVLLTPLGSKNEVEKVSTEVYVKENKELVKTDTVKSPEIEENTTQNPIHKGAEELTEVYGYDFEIVLNRYDNDTEVLLYNWNDRNALLIRVDDKFEVIEENEVKFSDELVGYNFHIGPEDCTEQNYILGIMSKPPIEGETFYSSIICIPKDNLSDVIIVRSFEQPYQSQGVIPTIIDFTLDIWKDYLTYQDTDGYWKVQDIVTGEVFNSGEDNGNTSEIHSIQGSFGDIKGTNEELYILKYKDTGSILGFDMATKEFIEITSE